MKRTSALARHAVFAAFVLGPVLAPLCAAQDTPVIKMFVAYPPEIAPGGTSSLVWEVSGATRLTLEPDVGPAIGEVAGPFLMVQPLQTTTYTLSAASDAGTAQASVTVTVVAGAGEDEDGEAGAEREDCPDWRGAGTIAGELTLSYSASAQGDSGAASLERQADVSLTFEKTPHGHWEGAATTGSARIRDTYTSSSLSERIEGEGAPNPETSTLRLNEDCTLSARVVIAVEAENSTVFGAATSTVGVVYLEGVAPSGGAELPAQVWHFGGENGVSLTQGQSYVEGFAQELRMLLGQDVLGSARVSWSFAPAP